MNALITPVRCLLAAALLMTFLVILGGCAPERTRLMDENRVIELLYKNQPQKALVAADETVVNAPEDFRGYLIRGYVHRVLNNSQAANADIAKARQLFAQGKTVSPQEQAKGFDAILAGMPKNMPLSLRFDPSRPEGAVYP